MEHDAETCALAPEREEGVEYAAAAAGGAPPAIEHAELRQLLSYFPADRVDWLLDKFVAELGQCNRELRRCLEAGDLPALSRCVHNIRGTALTSCFTQVSAYCDAVRSACKSGDVVAARGLGNRLAGGSEAALGELARLRREGAILA
jgi:hypothetical protein